MPAKGKAKKKSHAKAKPHKKSAPSRAKRPILWWWCEEYIHRAGDDGRLSFLESSAGGPRFGQGVHVDAGDHVCDITDNMGNVFSMYSTCIGEITWNVDEGDTVHPHDPLFIVTQCWGMDPRVAKPKPGPVPKK